MEIDDEPINDSGVSLITADRVLSPPNSDAGATVDLYDDLFEENDGTLQPQHSENHSHEDNQIANTIENEVSKISDTRNEASSSISPQITADSSERKASVEGNSSSQDLLDDCLLRQAGDQESVKKLITANKLQQTQLEKLQSQSLVLQKNMASLWKTARTLLREKDEKIAELKRKYEALVFRRSMRAVGEQDLSRLISSISAYTPSRMHKFLQELRRDRSGRKSCPQKLRNFQEPSVVKSTVRGSVVVGGESSSLVSLLPAQQKRLVSRVSLEAPEAVSVTGSVHLDDKSATVNRGHIESCISVNDNSGNDLCSSRSATMSHTSRLVKQAKDVLQRCKPPALRSPRKVRQLTANRSENPKPNDAGRTSSTPETRGSISPTSSQRKVSETVPGSSDEENHDLVLKSSDHVAHRSSKSIPSKTLCVSDTRHSGVPDNKERELEQVFDSNSKRQREIVNENCVIETLREGSHRLCRKRSRWLSPVESSETLPFSKEKVNCNKKSRTEEDTGKRDYIKLESRSRASRDASRSESIRCKSRNGCDEAPHRSSIRQRLRSPRAGGRREPDIDNDLYDYTKRTDHRRFIKRHSDWKLTSSVSRSRLSRRLNFERDKLYSRHRRGGDTSREGRRGLDHARHSPPFHPRTSRRTRQTESSEQQKRMKAHSRREKSDETTREDRELQRAARDAGGSRHVCEDKHRFKGKKTVEMSQRSSREEVTLVNDRDAVRLSLERERLIAELRELEAPSQRLCKEATAVVAHENKDANKQQESRSEYSSTAERSGGDARLSHNNFHDHTKNRSSPATSKTTYLPDNPTEKFEKSNKRIAPKLQNSHALHIDESSLYSRPKFANIMDDTIDKIVKNYNETNPSLSPVPSEASLLHFLEPSINEEESVVTFKDALHLSNCEVAVDGDGQLGSSYMYADRDSPKGQRRGGCEALGADAREMTRGDISSNSNARGSEVKNARVRRIHPTPVQPGAINTPFSVLKTQVVELVPVKEYTVKAKQRLPTASAVVVSPKRPSFESSPSTREVRCAAAAPEVSDAERDIGNSDSSDSTSDHSEVSKDSFIAKTSDEDVLPNSKNKFHSSILNMDLSLSADSSDRMPSRRQRRSEVDPKQVETGSTHADRWAESPAKNTRSQKRLHQSTSPAKTTPPQCVKSPKKALSPSVELKSKMSAVKSSHADTSLANSLSSGNSLCNATSVESASTSDSCSSTSSSSSSSSSGSNSAPGPSSHSASNVSGLSNPGESCRPAWEKASSNLSPASRSCGIADEANIEQNERGINSPHRNEAVVKKFRALFACESSSESYGEVAKSVGRDSKDIDGKELPKSSNNQHNFSQASLSSQSSAKNSVNENSVISTENDDRSGDQIIIKKIKLSKRKKPKRLSCSLSNSMKVVSMIFNDKTSSLDDAVQSSARGEEQIDNAPPKSSNDSTEATHQSSIEPRVLDALKIEKSSRSISHSNISTPTLSKVRKRILATPEVIPDRCVRRPSPAPLAAARHVRHSEGLTSTEDPTSCRAFGQGCVKEKQTCALILSSNSGSSSPFPLMASSSAAASFSALISSSAESSITMPASSVCNENPSVYPSTRGTSFTGLDNSCPVVSSTISGVPNVAAEATSVSPDFKSPSSSANRALNTDTLTRCIESRSREMHSNVSDEQATTRRLNYPLTQAEQGSCSSHSVTTNGDVVGVSSRASMAATEAGRAGMEPGLAASDVAQTTSSSFESSSAPNLTAVVKLVRKRKKGLKLSKS